MQADFLLAVHSSAIPLTIASVLLKPIDHGWGPFPADLISVYSVPDD
jgi:hypothetical protein